MACLTPLSFDEAKTLASEYGLDLLELDPLDAGSVNSNFRFVCRQGVVFGRIFEEQPLAGAAAEVTLLRELSRCGVEVTAPVERCDEAAVGVVRGKPFSLYPWVEGEWLCHQRLTPEHCRILGSALARVHVATPSLSRLPEGRFGLPQLKERLTFIEERAPEHREATTFLRQAIARYEAERVPSLPVGLIHGDLFRDNVLWRQDGQAGEPALAALLDFESASSGVFVYDVMVCILSWCFTGELELRRVHALLDGYESVRRLTDAERQATSTEGMAVCLRFATTRITDFEMRAAKGETPKRDYRRFFERYSALRGGVMDRVWSARARV